MQGVVTHSFTALQEKVDSIYLDGPGIEISQAKLNGKDIKFEKNGPGFTFYFEPALRWNSSHELTIDYSCHPKKGIYFIGWNDPKNISRKQIWTQGQGIDNRHWIPMYDTQNDKITSEMIVRFEKEYKVLSNGAQLKTRDNKDGTLTWHYKISKPHASYLIMLGIGDYKIKQTESASGVPMQLYYYPEWENRVDAAYKYSVEMFDWMEKLIGVKYPWENYSQIPVQDFMYGAMENTSSTIFGDFYFVDERSYLDKNYVRVNAHELAHQWFGDMITARTSQDHWLQESFATHYDMLYQREAFGEDHYAMKRREAQRSALNASLQDYRPIAHSQAGTVRHYPKGAVVLHMLRYVVGDEQFNATIKYYLEKHAYKNVDSEDLLIAFHEKLGLSLDWFWEQWVYHGGEPHYKVSFDDVKMNGKRSTNFTVKQVHERNDVVGLFKMPIVFEVYYKDGSMSKKVAWIENESHTISLPNERNQDIAYVLFDPNSEIMKKVEFEKSFEMLKAQCSMAKNMIDKYDALKAMRSIPFEKKVHALQNIWDSNSYWMIKNEILFQAKDSDLPAAIGFYKAACAGKDRDVQLAALTTRPSFASTLSADYEKLLEAQSYDVVTMALEVLCTNNPTNVDKYLATTKDVVGTLGCNVRIKHLEMRLAFGPEYALDGLSPTEQSLVVYVSNSYEFRTRVNAAQALQRLNAYSPELISNLFGAVQSSNSRLAGPCGSVLRHFWRQPAFKAAIMKELEASGYKGAERQKIERFLK